MKIVTFVGKLVRDPRASQERESGRPMAFATLEVLTGARDDEAVEKEYVDLVFFDGQTAHILEKGRARMKLFVTGREHLKHFYRRDKTQATMNEVFVGSYHFVFD